MLVFMALVFFGCFEQNDCLINNTNILKVALKGKTSGKDTTVTFISIQALGVINGDTDVSKPIVNIVNIPVQVNDSITTIIFKYNKIPKIITDTLIVRYRNETRVISEDCGAFLYQHDLAVPKTTFEKVRILTSVLLTTDKKNIEIFL